MRCEPGDRDEGTLTITTAWTALTATDGPSVNVASVVSERNTRDIAAKRTGNRCWLPSEVTGVPRIARPPMSDEPHATVADFFGERAAGYESEAIRGIPRRDEMFGALMDALPSDVHDILELGCGPGALTVGLAERYPHARITAVDAAAEMLDVARERLGPAAEGVRFVASTFEKFEAGMQDFDLVTGSMSLHHVVEKKDYYRRLHASLRPGGFLIFADELVGALPHVEQHHRQGWLDFASAPGHLTEAEIADCLDHEARFDHFETLPAQIDLLRAAGFASVDCAWRYLNYAVFVAAV